MDDVSVSLSSYDPHEDYHVPSDYDFTGGEDLETKPKEKMNQRSAVTPDAHSRPTKVTRYVVNHCLTKLFTVVRVPDKRISKHRKDMS